jgi:hypothetical protein
VVNITLIVEGDHNQLIRWTPCVHLFLKLKRKETGSHAGVAVVHGFAIHEH